MTDLLSLALNAGIPILRASTDDPVNTADVLSAISKRPVHQWTGKWETKTDCVLWLFGDDPNSGKLSQAIYNDLLTRNLTVLVLNDDGVRFDFALDCGPIITPTEYIMSQLSALLPASQVKMFANHFFGMSVTKIVETIMVTQARDGALSVRGINETKSYLGHGISGLEALDTKQDFYVPPDWLNEWVNTDAKFIGNTKPGMKQFWPKGFMLHGEPGTGKTELARYLASIFGWPAFKIDGGNIYSRWQGESEARLRKVLSFIGNQGECVFLIDEADKLFSQKAEGQASMSTMLSMILWWLEGGSNKAITVMTANDIGIIPPELYRPGRLDAVHYMSGLSGQTPIIGFVQSIAQTFAPLGVSVNVTVDHVIQALGDLNKTYPHAMLVGVVRQEVKKQLLLLEGAKL